MIPIVSPNLRTAWPKSAAAWAAWRTTRKTLVYPSQYPIPSAGVDSVTNDWNTYTPGFVPVGADSVQVLHDLTPGGRTGGSELNLELCIPSATPIGKVAVFLNGHTGSHGSGTGWDYQVHTVTHSTGQGPAGIIEPLLARGVHVLSADMPDAGNQPNPWINVGGNVVNLGGHNFSSLDGDGGPPSMQMFTRYIIRGITSALQIASASDVAVFGWSGGGTVAAVLAAMDDRISHFYCLQGGTAYGCDGFTLGDFNSTVAADWEGDFKDNTYYTSLAAQSFGASLIAGAAFSGRRTVWAVGADDTNSVHAGTYVDQVAFLRICEAANDQIRSTGGVILPYIQPAGSGHYPSPAECAFCIADWLG